MTIVANSDDSVLTIIITSFNYAKYIEQSVRSVINQTSAEWRLFIYDNQSTDNTVELLQPFIKDSRVTLIVRDENVGFRKNFELACREVKTEFISSLQADDYLEPTFVEVALKMLRAHKASPFVFFDWQQYFEDTQKFVAHGTAPFPKTRSGPIRIGPYLTICNFVPLHMVVFRTSCFLAQLDLLLGSPLAQVLEQYILKVLEDNYGFGCYSGSLGGYWRRHSQQITFEHYTNSVAYIEESVERQWYITHAPNPDPVNAFLTLAALLRITGHVDYLASVNWLLSTNGRIYAKGFNFPIDTEADYYDSTALVVALKFLTYSVVKLIDAALLTRWLQRKNCPITPEGLGDLLETVRARAGHIFLSQNEIKDICNKLWEIGVFTQKRHQILIYSTDKKISTFVQIRLLQPFNFLANDYELIWGENEKIENKEGGDKSRFDLALLSRADLIVVQRYFVVEAYKEEMECILKAGRPVVFDMDDLLFDLLPDNARYAFAHSNKDYLLSIIERVDAVIVATPALAEAIKAVVQPKQIYILPNAVNAVPFYREPARRVEPVRIALTGTPTHKKDYAIVEKALDRVVKKYGQRVHLVFMGETPKRWQGQTRVTSVEFVQDYSLFARTLPKFELDIALVPLVDNVYNRCKSNLKWLEYSAAGIAGIYSDIEPYALIRQNITGVKVVNTPEAWFSAICNLIDHPEKRLLIARAAQAEVLANFTAELRAKDYARVYAEILAARPFVHRVDLSLSGAEHAETTEQDFYGLWQQGHSYQNRDAIWLAERMAAWPVSLRFHLAIIVPEGGEARLVNNIKSMGHQFHTNWQLTVISSDVLLASQLSLGSVTWIQSLPENCLAAVNRALLETPADWVALWEAGDKLAPHALFSFSEKVMRHPEFQVLYSDEDRVDAEDAHFSPFFKTDFNLEMLRAAPFAVGGLLLLKRDLFAELNGFDPEMEGVEAFDLTLRAWEKVGLGGLGHLADVLYHRHLEGGHGRSDSEAIAAAHSRALEAHLERCGFVGEVSALLEEGLLPGTVHVRYPVRGNPLVSILIQCKNQLEILKRCLTSLIEGTGYSNCEILLLDKGSDEADAVLYLSDLKALDSPRLRVLHCAGLSNSSAINNLGAREATGEYLMLLSCEAAVLHEAWLEEMLGIAQQPDVGAVGAKLIDSNGSIEHVGIILGINDNPADFPFIQQSAQSAGYFGRAKLTQEFSAVTGACLLVKRALYLEMGGFDEVNFKGAYNDIDFCQRLRREGYRNVFTPHAYLLLSELNIQNSEAESDRFYDRWRQEVAFDPAYNRNLSTHGRNFILEIAPALAWDPEWRPRPRILAHAGDRAGCGEYRIIAPMRALNEAGRVMGWETGNYLSTPELFRMEPDSILLQRQVDPHQIELMERYIRHSKALKIFEVDDLITNIPVLSSRKKHFVVQKDLHRRFRKCVEMCDRFIVSTDFLAQEYKGYIDDIRVVQNYIERARWGELKPLRLQRKKARVGWAGGSTHDGDLMIIIDMVKATAKEVDWVFMGMCPDEIRPYIVEFHQGVQLDDYPAKLASLNLDLAVAPLEDVPFNHAKSHLRLLEYGVLGYPVICTDITPYRGDYPVTRVPNRFKDWVDAIRSHVADRDELARRGDVLRDYINANWILEDNLDVWAQAWLP